MTDAVDDLERPIFGDWTLVSKRHIPEVVARVRERAPHMLDGENERYYIWFLECYDSVGIGETP